MAAPRKGSPGLTVSAYARSRRDRHLPGCSLRAVTYALESGRIHRRRDGLIDPAQADRDWIANTQMGRSHPNAGRKSTAAENQRRPRKRRPESSRPTRTPAEDLDAELGGNPSLTQAQTVKTAYQARLAYLQYRTRLGELVAIEQVRSRAFLVARNVRNQLLAIPARMSAVLASMTQQEEIERVLNDELRRALEGLAYDPAGPEQLEELQAPAEQAHDEDD